MRCTRTFSLWFTVLGGAAIALGSISSPYAFACDPYADIPAAASLADGSYLPPTHRNDSSEGTDYATADNSAEKQTADSGSRYHYEYPEYDYGYSTQEPTESSPAGYDSCSAEAYAFKYGYRYATSGKLYGEEHASDPNEAKANESTEADDDASMSAQDETVSDDAGESQSASEAGHDGDDAMQPQMESSESAAAPQSDDAGDSASDSSADPMASTMDDAENDDMQPADETANEPSNDYSYNYDEEPAEEQPTTPSNDADQWTYQSENYDLDYSDAATPASSESSPTTSEVSKAGTDDEPETLADYAKWVLVYGYTLADKWLAGEVAGEAAPPSETNTAQEAKADTTGNSTYDFSHYEGAHVGRLYGYTVDPVNPPASAEANTPSEATTSTPTEQTASPAASAKEEYVYPADEALEGSSYDEYGYEKSYRGFCDETPSPQAAEVNTPVSSDYTEIWNRYRYEYYYQSENQDNELSVSNEPTSQDLSVSNKPADQADSCSTEQASNEGACGFEYGYCQHSQATTDAVSGGIPQEGYADYYHAHPHAYYGYDYRGYQQWQAEQQAAVEAQASHRESGLELFEQTPAELLTNPDQDLLRTLERLSEEPSGVRRAVLNEYLETLGSPSISFVFNVQDTTGIEVLELADDVLSTAALLSTYRLMERGELGQDEAVDLLRRSLQNLSLDWTASVRAITAHAYETGLFTEPRGVAAVDPIEAHAVSGALVSLVIHSLSGVSEAVWSLSQDLGRVDWQAMVFGLESLRAAKQNGLGEDWFQR